MNIIVIIKFFKEKEHAENFISGNIHINNFEYYRNIDKETNRKDEREAVCKQGRLDSSKGVTINNVPIDIIEGSFTEFAPCSSDVKILCTTLYYASSGSAFHHLTSPEVKNLADKFGNHIAVCLNLDGFIEALKRHGYLQCSTVSYYDRNKDLNFGKLESLFCKPNEFKDENEFRILLKSKNNKIHVKENPNLFTYVTYDQLVLRQ
jgi:hypothetical protein